jgi:hypothetical protein
LPVVDVGAIATQSHLLLRIHPQIAWAKLEALAQGAALATRQLWR